MSSSMLVYYKFQPYLLILESRQQLPSQCMNGPCFQYLEQYFLTDPLCTKHKFCYSNIIMMIPLKITTILSEILKKMCESVTYSNLCQSRKIYEG